MNFRKSLERLGLDEDEYLELIELFVETSRSDINKLRSAINGGDTKKASEIAHSLKGAAVNLGLEAFLELAGKIEETVRDGKLETTAKTASVFQEKLNHITDFINS